MRAGGGRNNGGRIVVHVLTNWANLIADRPLYLSLPCWCMAARINAATLRSNRIELLCLCLQLH